MGSLRFQYHINIVIPVDVSDLSKQFSSSWTISWGLMRRMISVVPDEVLQRCVISAAVCARRRQWKAISNFWGHSTRSKDIRIERRTEKANE
ncbi:hypothetical protein RB195_015508 [Necator americanus]|uniref:Uncharacterized protein n=1 Tax=Necator americanus TaxID=51031 RepID=A0ABR1E5D6_NECAM